MALELRIVFESFKKKSRIPLLSASLTNFWLEKLMNCEDNFICALFLILLDLIFGTYFVKLLRSKFCRVSRWQWISSKNSVGIWTQIPLTKQLAMPNGD